MELLESIEKRTSIRKYTDEKVSVEHLKDLVRCAGQAPSVNNYQPWHFTAITNAGLLQKMSDLVSAKIKQLQANTSKAADNIKSQVEWFSTFFAQAPALLVMSMEEYETVLEKGVELTHDEINHQRNYPDLQSAGAAIQNILLRAVDLDYGACWMSAPLIAKEELSELIGLPKNHNLIAFVTVGKAARPLQPKAKKSIDEIFSIIE